MRDSVPLTPAITNSSNETKLEIQPILALRCRDLLPFAARQFQAVYASLGQLDIAWMRDSIGRHTRTVYVRS
jgi:hypothetical protein